MVKTNDRPVEVILSTGDRFDYKTLLDMPLMKISKTGKPEPDYSLRHLKDRPVRRKCLSCREDFESDGWGNRLCMPCKRRKG